MNSAGDKVNKFRSIMIQPFSNEGEKQSSVVTLPNIYASTSTTPFRSRQASSSSVYNQAGTSHHSLSQMKTSTVIEHIHDSPRLFPVPLAQPFTSSRQSSPQTPLKPTGSSSSYLKAYNEKHRNRRGGWWDESPDKVSEMNHVKSLLRRHPPEALPLNVSTEHREHSEPRVGEDKITIPNDSPSFSEKKKVVVSEKIKVVVQRNKNPFAANGVERNGQIEGQALSSPKTVTLTSEDNQAIQNHRNVEPGNSIARAAETADTSHHRPLSDPLKSEVGVQTLPWDSAQTSEKSNGAHEEENKKLIQQLEEKEHHIQRLQTKLGHFTQIKKSHVDTPKPAPARRMDQISLLLYLMENKMATTLRAFLAESDLPSRYGNYFALKSMLDEKDFVNAISIVQRVMNEATKTSTSFKSSMIASFEDLIYVLSKYFIIHLYQTHQIQLAIQTLEQILLPLVQKEQRRGGVRANWFSTDYQMLKDTILPRLSENSGQPVTIYTHFHWEKELNTFWKSAGRAFRAHENQQENGWKKRESNIDSSDLPLFTQALASYFFVDADELKGASSLDTIFSKARQFDELLATIDKMDEHGSIVDVGLDERPPKRGNIASASEPEPNKSPIEKRTKNARQLQNEGPIEKAPSQVSTKSYGPYHETSISIPQSTGQESATFALSSLCGPSIGPTRVMDLREWNGSLIVATAPSEDRTDKHISIWDAAKNEILSRLDNVTSKPVVFLLFHPSFPELLLSADMEFDVKLWNWREGTLVRWWKKHHTRIIYKLMFVPGDDTRAISCSGDQSIKLWSIHADKPQCTSVHANEPITSFVIVGAASDPHQQKIIASLSYSLRIYKLRTLSMIYNMNLNELKLNKTPISSLCSHPQFEHLILFSCENQLRLYDLSQEAFIRNYSARHLEPGTRVEGKFSPCGDFVYCSPMDVRSRVTPGRGEIKPSGLKSTNQAQTSEENSLVYLWRVHTGKLEKADMNAILRSSETVFQDVEVKPCPVLACSWILLHGPPNKRKQGLSKKYLVATGADRLIRIYV